MRAIAWLSLFALAALGASVPGSLGRPIFTIPLFVDDTLDDGLTASLLTSYLVMVKNKQGVYPFEIDLNITFAESTGPDLFYKALRRVKDSKEGNKPTVIMGPEYSSAVQLISTIADVEEIPIMAFWATSPYLSSKREYPMIWRAASSDAIRMKAWIDVFEKFQWAHAVVIEETTLYGRGATEYFELEASQKGIRVWRILVETKQDIPHALQRIRDIGCKLIIAPLSEILSEVATTAAEKKMIGPTSGYVWIFGDAITNLLGKHYLKAYTGSLAALEPNDLLKAEYNVSQYTHLLDESYRFVERVYNQINRNDRWRSKNTSRDLFAVRDLIWTAASMPTSLARGLLVICESAASYYKATGVLPSSGANMTAQFIKFSSDILGARVTFDQNQDFSTGKLRLTNVRADNPHHIFADWDPKGGVVFNAKDPIIWPDGTTRVPDDGLAKEQYYSRVGVFGVVIISVSIIMCVIIFLTFALVILYFRTPVFRFASPYSLLTILVGLFLLTCGVVFYLDRPSRALCHLRNWFYYLGLTLFFSALIAKTWRVWMVFRESNSLKKGLVISNLRLMIYTGALCVPGLLLLFLRSTLDDDYDQRVLAKDLSRVDVVCVSKHMAWSYAEQAWAGAQMLAAAFLAFKTRNVPSGFNEAQHVFISVYSVCTVGIIGLIISTALQSSFPQLSLVFVVSSVITVSAIMWAMLFIPKLYIAVFHPEKNTTELMRQRERPANTPSINELQFAAQMTDTMQVPLMELDLNS